jgi:peptidoglycan/xylan/chitin deacetylase (PgdA/CDA1 family)
MDPRDHRSLRTSGPRTKRAGAAATAVALTTGAYWLPALAGTLRSVRAPLGIFDQTRDGRGCALTFDDGPHAQGTPQILEALVQRGAIATFFLVGEQVARNPALAREIVAAGHGIGLHCDRHRNMLRLGPRQVDADIDRAQARIEDATGAAIQLYRPPYGVFNLAALLHARRNGWRPLLWTQWGRDWEARATPSSIATLASKDIAPGSVVLLHDADDYGSPGSWRRTLGAVPLLLDAIEQRGLELVAA